MKLDRPKAEEHPSAATATLERQLATAQLKIAQLTMSPLSQRLESVTERLRATERELVTVISEFRYTQISLEAHHDALRLELRDALALATAASDTEGIRRAAIRASMEASLRQHIGFRLQKVSEAAPLVPVQKGTPSTPPRTTDL